MMFSGKASLSFLLYGSESTHGLREKAGEDMPPELKAFSIASREINFLPPSMLHQILSVGYQRLEPSGVGALVAAWSASNFIISYPFVSFLSSWQYLLFQQFSDRDSVASRPYCAVAGRASKSTCMRTRCTAVHCGAASTRVSALNPVLNRVSAKRRG